MYFDDNLDKIIASLNKFAFANKDILIKNNATISGSFALYLQFYEPCEDDDFDIDIVVDNIKDFVNLDFEYKKVKSLFSKRSVLYDVDGINIHISEKICDDAIQFYTCPQLALPIASSCSIIETYKIYRNSCDLLRHLTMIERENLCSKLCNVNNNIYHLQSKIIHVLYNILMRHNGEAVSCITKELIKIEVEREMIKFFLDLSYRFEYRECFCDSYDSDIDVTVNFVDKCTNTGYNVKTSTKGDSLNILNLPSCFRLND